MSEEVSELLPLFLPSFTTQSISKTYVNKNFRHDLNNSVKESIPESEDIEAWNTMRGLASVSKCNDDVTYVIS